MTSGVMLEVDHPPGNPFSIHIGFLASSGSGCDCVAQPASANTDMTDEAKILFITIMP
ncbi:hypothetical protein N779_12840 [Vibrio coralliilyticus OCN008]|nr:hypothetical protein N779_12840 [Vibrio coralliilyticus OCN008]